MQGIMSVAIVMVKDAINVIRDGDAPISVKSIINGIHLDHINQLRMINMV